MTATGAAARPAHRWARGSDIRSAWASDWYGEEEYKQFASRVAVDPQASEQGSFRNALDPLELRVIRGASWINDGPRCRPACRGYEGPQHGLHILGFRLALGESGKRTK